MPTSAVRCSSPGRILFRQTQILQAIEHIVEERKRNGAFKDLFDFCHRVDKRIVNRRVVESLVRAGESELLKMRSRLLQLMSALTSFADSRARSPEGGKLTAETRELFESASGELLRVARDFERTGRRTAGLANNGSTFVTACIQTCGIQPTTYRAPYSRRGEARAWG